MATIAGKFPWLRLSGLVVAGVGLLLTGFFAGRLSQGSSASNVASSAAEFARPVQFQFPQTPPDQGAQELIPLPGPGRGNQPGQGQQPQPGQGQQPQECPIFIYQDGRLYQLPRPGQEQQPGSGMGPLPGQPGGSPELIPLEPINPGPTPTTPLEPPSPQPNNRT
ncbi:hypothetical protein [Calidithermus timidus]|jgi:hypothetical protein|uniref:hypothetical protein n=1 Tax=Calidithermus timidus TaxID=307124 RepID=UPI00037A4C53|nr:hypothetical protein [Calidithermus timidus]